MLSLSTTLSSGLPQHSCPVPLGYSSSGSFSWRPSLPNLQDTGMVLPSCTMLCHVYHTTQNIAVTAYPIPSALLVPDPVSPHPFSFSYVLSFLSFHSRVLHPSTPISLSPLPCFHPPPLCPLPLLQHLLPGNFSPKSTVIQPKVSCRLSPLPSRVSTYQLNSVSLLKSPTRSFFLSRMSLPGRLHPFLPQPYKANLLCLIGILLPVSHLSP